MENCGIRPSARRRFSLFAAGLPLLPVGKLCPASFAEVGPRVVLLLTLGADPLVFFYGLVAFEADAHVLHHVLGLFVPSSTVLATS